MNIYFPKPLRLLWILVCFIACDSSFFLLCSLLSLTVVHYARDCSCAYIQATVLMHCTQLVTGWGAGGSCDELVTGWGAGGSCDELVIGWGAGGSCDELVTGWGAGGSCDELVTGWGAGGSCDELVTGRGAGGSCDELVTGRGVGGSCRRLWGPVMTGEAVGWVVVFPCVAFFACLFLSPSTQDDITTYRCTYT